jgi:hypothetical protein
MSDKNKAKKQADIQAFFVNKKSVQYCYADTIGDDLGAAMLLILYTMLELLVHM